MLPHVAGVCLATHAAWVSPVVGIGYNYWFQGLTGMTVSFERVVNGSKTKFLSHDGKANPPHGTSGMYEHSMVRGKHVHANIRTATRKRHFSVLGFLG